MINRIKLKVASFENGIEIVFCKPNNFYSVYITNSNKKGINGIEALKVLNDYDEAIDTFNRLEKKYEKIVQKKTVRRTRKEN